MGVLALANAVRYQLNESVVTLTLNRPERLNALNGEMLSRLSDTLREVDQSIRAVVIRGAGRAFCAGVDLRDQARRERDIDAQRRSVEQLQELARCLRQCPAPVIALVHGHAVGGGAEIALCCDIVIAAEDAIIGFPETAVGVSVTSGLSWTLGRLVGPIQAKRMILLGDFVSGKQARELGLATEAVPASDLDLALEKVLAQLRRRSANALRLSKQLLNGGSDVDFERALANEVDAALVAAASDDAREGAEAFLRKRAPNFGRHHS